MTMGLLTSFTASTSVSAWIELLIFSGALFLNYWATMRIIAQAGYSPLWILLPLSPLVLTTICYIIFWSDIHEVFFGGGFGGGFGIDSHVSLIWHLDELSIVVSWLFFIVFAFSRWPVSGQGHTRVADGSPLPLRVDPKQPASALPPPDSSGVARVASRPPVSSAAGPGVGPRAPVARNSAQHCAWCGESLPGNRALFHDCGPKDRPETFCKICGVAFASGSTQCSSCGAA
jgi:hypothetical protein